MNIKDMKKLAWSFDGAGINDTSSKYRPRIATLSPSYAHNADYSRREDIGTLLAAAPTMLAALEAIARCDNVDQVRAIATNAARIASSGD